MNSEELKRLEEALNTDEALRARYGEAMSRVAAGGEQDPARVAAKAAAELGYDLDSGSGAAKAIGDEALDSVFGGTAIPYVGESDFNLNTWIGKLLRGAMKSDSADSLR